MIGGTVEGNENTTVYTFAKIEEGHPGAISFLANPKYTHHIYDSQSSIILVRNDFAAERPVRATLIRVADPYASIAVLMEKVTAAASVHPVGVEQPAFVAEGVRIPDDAYIGAFTYIGAGAELGAGVKVYPQAYVGRNVTIGEGTVVYAGVKIYDNVRIGRRCTVHAGAVIGADGFGFAPTADGSFSKIPQIGTVEIGDDVEIGANTTVDRATMGATRIMDGTKIDNLVQVAHNVTVGRNTALAAQVGIAGSAHIGNNCMLAGQVGVAGHIKVGDRVAVGAQSGIPNNVADDSRIMGYPAIPANEFLRRSALLRRLPELFDTVKDIEKRLNEKN